MDGNSAKYLILISRATPETEKTPEKERGNPFTELSKRKWEPKARASIKIGRNYRQLAGGWGRKVCFPICETVQNNPHLIPGRKGPH